VMALFEGRVYVAFAAVMAVLAIYRHKDNIKRLLKGQEKKIHEKKKDADAAHSGPR